MFRLFNDKLLIDDNGRLWIEYGQNVKFTINILNIGPWNMNSTASISLLHNLQFDKIMSVMGIVQNDAQTQKFQFDNTYLTLEVTPTSINMTRATNSRYKSASYSNSLINRGYLTIFYSA